MRRFLALFLLIFALWANSAFATVTNQTLKSGPFNTNGSTTVFTIGFQYLEDSDIAAQLTNSSTGAVTNLIQNSDFTVFDGTPPANDGTLPGGSITILPNAASGLANGSGQFPSGYTVTLFRNLALIQDLSYPEGGVFPSTSTEEALDYLTLIIQQQQNTLNNSIQIPSVDTGINTVLPSAAARANGYMGFDSSGNPTILSGTVGGVASLTASSPLAVNASVGAINVSIGSAVTTSLGGTGVTSAPANGQLLIGNGTGYTLANISAGSNIIITNSPGGIQIAATTTGGGGSSNIVLGSTTTANPQVSGQNGSGFYALGSTATSAYGAEVNGSKVIEFENLASGVDYLTVTPGKSGTPPTLSVNGSTANQSLNLTATGTGHIAISGIAQPTSVATNQVYQATSSSVIAPVSVSTMIDNGIGSTVGSLMLRTSTGWNKLTPTATGNVLTDNGPGNLPSYQVSASNTNGSTLLATINASGAASVVFSSTFITATYSTYVIRFDSVFTSAPDALNMQVSSNNGGSWLGGSDYYWVGTKSNPSITAANQVNGGGGGAGFFAISQGIATTNSSSQGARGTIEFSHPSVAAALLASWDMNGSISANNAGFATHGDGQYDPTSPPTINAVRLIPASGTITGNFHLYGLNGT